MGTKRQLQVVFGVTFYLLFVGILSYAVFPAETPEEPVRKMFKVAAGKVLFDHKIHSTPEGYGASCVDCHHHPSEDELDTRSCKECHLAAVTEELPEACMDCHDVDEIEGTEMIKSGDAFHNQCIGCHQDFDAGPVECAECHVM